MQDKQKAREIARALFQLIDADELELVYQCLVTINENLSTSEDFIRLLHHPLISSEQKVGALLELTDNTQPEILCRILTDMVATNSISQLPELIGFIEQFSRERSGTVDAEVISAGSLTEEEKRTLVERISSFAGSPAIVRFVEDTCLIAGFRIRIGDMILDNSVKYQMNAIEEQFRRSVPM